MREVTSECNVALVKHRTAAFRDGYIAEVSFGIINNDATADATYTISQGSLYSTDTQLLDSSLELQTAYATFEKGYFKLGSKQKIPPEFQPFLYGGYISNEMSDSDGLFQIPQTIEFDFARTHSIAGISISFDTIMNNAPRDFAIDAYNGDILIKSILGQENSEYEYRADEPLENFTKIVITFTKMAAFQRLHMRSIALGIGYVYRSGDTLASSSIERVGHPLNLVVPQSTATFSLISDDGRFAVTSDTSLVRFLKEGQKVVLRHGVFLDTSGDKIEWIKMGEFALESWDTEGINASFVAKGIFDSLSKTTFEKGLFTPDGHGASDGKTFRSIAELAAMVLDDAGIKGYYVNEHQAGRVSTYLAIPVMSHAEALQILGNVVNATFEEDANGKISLRNRNIPDKAKWKILKLSAPETPFSNLVSTLSDTNIDYASFEDSGFMLGSEQLILPEEAPFLGAGLVCDLFPNADGRYRYNGEFVGVRIDFVQNITAGGITIEFGAFSTIDTVLVIANRSGAGELWRKTFPVTNGQAKIDVLFDNVIWIFVIPETNTKKQRARVKGFSVSRTTGSEVVGEDLLVLAKEELMPSVKEVRVPYKGVWYWVYPYSVELEKISVPAGGLTKVSHPDIYYYVTATSPNSSVVFDIAEHYAYVSYIKISGVSGNADVILSGAKIARESTTTTISTVNGQGEDVLINNPIHQWDTTTKIAADFAADYYKKRVQYEVNTLAFPQIDVNDRILYKGREVVVVKHKITTGNGAAKSFITMRGD